MNAADAFERGRAQYEAAARGLQSGDRVRVSNPQRGAVTATVLHTTTPAALPSLPHEWDELKTRAVRRILEEWRVTNLALITYRYGPRGQDRDVCFFALEIAGRWYDLKRQPLTIERMEP